MTAAVPAIDTRDTLPSLVERAASALANAKTSAEVLEARDLAGLAYDAAKRAARLARAKKAHDEVISAVYRAQADALLIEARAKVRLADEYDAAQERGDVAKGRPRKSSSPEDFQATTTDLGLSHKQVHEARQIRDAEKLDPGSVERVLSGRAEAGDEPTRAALREAVVQVVEHGYRGPRVPAQSRKNPLYKPDPQHSAWVAVVGNCNRTVELIREYAPEYILGGYVNDFDRNRGLRLIRECRDELLKLLEFSNAHQS